MIAVIMQVIAIACFYLVLGEGGLIVALAAYYIPLNAVIVYLKLE